MRDFKDQNYYELLDISPTANQRELEEYYKRAQRFFGSDSVATYTLFEPDELEFLRRRIEEAYRVLSDPERRQRYDREVARAKSDPPDEVVEESKTTETPVVEYDTKLAVHPDSSPPPDMSQPEEVDDQPDDQVEEVVAEGQLIENVEKPAMPEISEETVYSGDFLRQVREARGYSLEFIADVTKIAIYYLRYLEAEDYSELPAKVYTRGYLRLLAQMLELKADKVVESYLARMYPPDDE
jgi:hypothetical protein